jgi:hypothetical protein
MKWLLIIQRRRHRAYRIIYDPKKTFHILFFILILSLIINNKIEQPYL